MNASTRRAASCALVLGLVLGFGLVGCQGAPIEGIEGEEDLAPGVETHANSVVKHACMMVAHLDGNHVVPSRSTDAFGLATLQLNRKWTKLSFQLIVGDIENVTSAHIHLGERGHDGPIVALLAGPKRPGGGPVNGTLKKGSLSARRLLGPLEDMSFAHLVEKLRDDEVYIDVHTDDGDEPADTGPGDFSGGEIRGQIDLLGPCGDD